MFKVFIKLALLCAISVGLHAQSGLTQQYLVSASPENLAEFETSDTTIDIEFTMPVIPKSVHKNTVVLKTATNKRLSGVSTVINNKLSFKPNNLLEVGTYEVLVSKMKLDDPSTNNTQTEKINYTFTVPDIKSIAISPQEIELKEGNQTSISVVGTYADNSTKEILNNIEWIIQDNSIASISNNTLTGISEGVTTIQAKFNNITSAPVTVVVYIEINGYKLPPEPDSAQNNSTMLGIDFNNNGVRDDVERKIIETYREPIKIELMMSRAKVAQEILTSPVGLATEHKNNMTKISNCQMYLRRQNIKMQDAIKSINNFTYTTKERVRAYLDYNLALSGGVYGSSPADWNAQACDFDVEQMLKDIK